MDNLKMVNGYLVPKSLANNADPMTAAQSALPGVTYATLKVSVQPATDVALPPLKAPSGGGGGSDDSDDSAAKTSKKKKPS
jgi:hypothetical protein